MNFGWPYLWVLPVWGLLGNIYFVCAGVYLWKRTGLNMMKVWMLANTDSLTTERRFAAEIRMFPKWNFGYQVYKWGTLAVIVGYLTSFFYHIWPR